MKKASLILFVMLALAASAAAQNKFSETSQCGKAEKDYKIEVGDRPGHVFQIIQVKCSFTKGEIEGIQIKEELATEFSEIREDAGRGRWLSVLTMANGDKVYCHGELTLTLKNGVPQIEEGRWNWSGGTGKLKGIKGKGTYKANIAADGSGTVEGEGEYTMPASKK